MERCRRRGLLAPSALPGKAAAGGGRKPPACHEDNVLGGHAVEATSFAPARPQEYRKVFGAASACSIPVLDLPSASDGCGCLGFSALDYLDIFGGFDGRDFGVPYEELFFDATEESSGAGAPPSPLPAPDDTAPLSANTCISRQSKEMSYLTHGIPLPEWPGGDSIGSSLSRVVHHLSDGTKQTNLSDHTARWNSKDDPVHGTIHKNQVHAISRSTIFVEHTKTNIPDIQVVTDICLYSSGSKETMKGQHLKKTVVSTSCSSTKHPQIDMKAEPRPPKSEFCASRIALYEQNESLISSNQSMVSRSNVASAKFSNNHSLHEDFVEKKTERKWQNDTAQSTFMSMKSGIDLKVQCFASEHIPAKEALFSCSSSDLAASSSPELSSDHLTNHINLDIVDARIVEVNHTSPSPSCASSQTSDYDNKVEEKQFDTISKFLEMSPVNESYRSHVSSNHLISSWCQSYPHAPFLTVSDVILRTQPSQGPPPSRLPPARSPQCSDLDVRRLSAKCHSFNIATGAPFTTRSFKQAESDISPPSFVTGVNESSRAVSLVAPIKEAMELAQARVKAAKPSMKGNDNFQIGLKSGVSDGRRSIDRGEDKAIQDNRRNREDIVVQLTQNDNDGKVNKFATEKMMREFRVSRQAANFKEKERNCGPVDWSLQGRQLEEVSEQALVHEETEKKMTLTEKLMKGQEGLNNQNALGKSIDQDANEKELEATHASLISAEDIALTGNNQEEMRFNCIMTDESSCFHEVSTEKFGGSKVETSIRCKARMERHQRTVERMAKALSEKNMRDMVTQREQAERNILAETLDADVRRWSNGKEGDLRALLSTLQYILGPESGWQPIPLTDVITASAVKKAYRKAMLYIHPDKIQQRSASIRQKYICEKVFDLIQEARNKFHSEEC